MGIVLERGMGMPIEDFWCGEYMPHPRVPLSTVKDFYPAFNRAQQTYERALTNDAGGAVASHDRARGFTLLFGPGDYYFSQTPTLIRGMHLLGQGGLTRGTVFRYADGIDGLHARFRDTPDTPPTAEPPISDPPLPPRSPIGGSQGRSDTSAVENIYFVGHPWYARNNHGIWALAPIRISNCSIQGWGQNGIRMTSAPETTSYFTGHVEELYTSTTNLSLVEHCIIQGCGWRGINRVARDGVHNANDWIHFGEDYDYYDGIYIEGGNSNGSLFSAVHCLSNGRWGFYDASRTGCTFLACMTHDNARVRVVHASGTQTTTSLQYGGCFKVADSAARSVLIGCYAESDQRGAEVSAHTLILGGAMAVNISRGQYFSVDNSNVLNLQTGVSVWNRAGTDTGKPWAKGTLGTTRGQHGEVFQAHTEEEPAWPLNLKYDEDFKTWVWRHDSYPYMVLGTKSDNLFGSPGDGVGHVLFPKGISLGSVPVRTDPKPGPKLHFGYEGRHGGATGMIHGIAKTQEVRTATGTIKRTLFEGYTNTTTLPNAGDWNVGDRLWDESPEPGGWMGWVCTQSSTRATPTTPYIPATWKRFGAIET